MGGFFDKLGQVLGGESEEESRIGSPRAAEDPEFARALEAVRKRSNRGRIGNVIENLATSFDPQGDVSVNIQRQQELREKALQSVRDRFEERDARSTAKTKESRAAAAEGRAVAGEARALEGFTSKEERLGTGETRAEAAETRTELAAGRDEAAFQRSETIRETKDDPNSDVSVRIRTIVQKMFPGAEFDENATAAELEDQGFDISKLLSKELEVTEATKTATALATSKREAVIPEAEKVSQRELAKDFEDFKSKGGKAEFDTNRAVIVDVINELEAAEDDITQTISGRVVGRLPDFFRSEKGIQLEQKVNKVVLASLRQTLGAQFTEAEGTRVLKLTFDPTLSPEVNLEKLRDFLTQQDLIIANKLESFQRLPESVRGVSEDQGSTDLDSARAELARRRGAK